MNKSAILGLIKNIFAVIFAFILSITLLIICIVGYVVCWHIFDVKLNHREKPNIVPIEIHYKKDVQEYIKPPKTEELNSEFCINTVKIKDDKNNKRYFYCRYKDSISYGKNGEPISRNKVFNEYYLDENKNVTEIIGLTPVSTISDRYIYNDNGKLILYVGLDDGWFPIHVYIYK